MRKSKRLRHSEVLYVRLTPGEKAALRAAAAKAGLGEGEFVRRAIAYDITRRQHADGQEVKP
jgi:hypothetical protein